MARAVFLDRDGVINRRAPEGHYINSLAEFKILPGVTEAISRLNGSGFLVLVATNQRCIARGIVPAEVVAQIHATLRQQVEHGGGRIDGVYVCPHDYGDVCNCRKPKPGMLLQAAKDFGLDLSQCWMVGDCATDIKAGHSAGCRTVAIGAVKGVNADFTAATLAEAVEQIFTKP